ncbi:MAG: ribosome small subunit-dependent GTPase A [Clostridia bacterium]|nr:ribosome small subunit-dependent GTPase A [Clostridia bacterium]
MIDMKQYGLDGRVEALAYETPQYDAARIIAQERGVYRLVMAQGEKLAEVSGRLRGDARTPSDYPAVGDFVMADWNEDGRAVIHRVLPRKSCFLRKAAGSRQEQVVAANVDTVFLCMSLNHDFNLRRLERSLSIAWDSGATPVVVLTKADLCEDPAQLMAEASSVAFGVDILLTTSMEEDGWRQILPYLSHGRTVAFIGSSGVGKSTLINRLTGEERLATQGLRNDDKGRHTTTHRELILLEMGGMVIDTPGMREMGMWDSDAGVDRTFAEIDQLAAQCRFADCSHGSEPGCAVRAALRSGDIQEERFAAWQKLKAELTYAADSRGYLAAKERKFKEIAKFSKSLKKR